MRLLFAGTPEVALPSLRLLLAQPQHDVVAVLTRPPARSGRGRIAHESPVAAVATAAGVPVRCPHSPADPEFLAELTEFEIDCAPVVAYGAILRPATLAVPKHGWVNLHFSLLPAWRGAAPVQRALLRGDDLTGASTFLIGEGLDDGPVFGVVTEAVRATDTSGDLLARLADSGARLLLATMDGIADASLRPQPQPVDGVSTAPKLSSEDARVRVADPAFAVDRRVRACTPAPGAWLLWRDERLKIGPVQPIHATTELAPGELATQAGHVLVGTATDAVRLGWVQPPGKKPMPAVDWARGARLAPGERLE